MPATLISGVICINIKKTLCKNMTDMTTVLVFDRETCYETQNAEDAFVFERIETDLPDFKMKPKDRGKMINKQLDTDGHVSFMPGHRFLKLGYKQLVLDGKVREMEEAYGKTRQFYNELRYLAHKEAEQLKLYPIKINGPLLPYPLSVVKNLIKE